MVCNDPDSGTLKVTSPHLESMYHCKEFLFPHSIVPFRRRHLPTLIGNRPSFLEKNCPNGMARRVTDNLERFAEIRCCQDRCLSQSHLEGVKRVLARVSPLKGHILLGQIMKWARHLRVPLNKAPEIVREAQKGADMCHGARHRPVLDRGHFGRIGFDSILADNMSQE
jgi:hypothetical protein